MDLISKFISAIGLILTILPSLLVFSGQMTMETSKVIMLIGTLIWFLSSPRWINNNQ